MNERQLEAIAEFKEDYDIDLSKGFYWQIEYTDDGHYFIFNPKEYWETDECLFDQHTDIQIFLTNEDRKLLEIEEVQESIYEHVMNIEDFRKMMKKYEPFFEEKKMF